MGSEQEREVGEWRTGRADSILFWCRGGKELVQPCVVSLLFFVLYGWAVCTTLIYRLGGLERFSADIFTKTTLCGRVMMMVVTMGRAERCCDV